MKPIYKCMIFINTIILLIIILFGIILVKRQNDNIANTPNTPFVSMINLISTPEKYDKKKIIVTGVSSIQMEDTAIYLSIDDFKYLNSNNAIWTDIKDKNSIIDMNGKFVTIEGIFNMNDKGHMNAYAGTISLITTYEEETTIR